jgi:MFS family permease
MESSTVEKLRRSIPSRLDSLKFSRFHLTVIIALGISWVLDGYEVSLLSVLSGVLKDSLSMSDSEIGFTGSCYLLGCVIGSLLFGYFASKLGRKTLFSITLGLYTISIIFTAASLNKYMFMICRLFTGISVGGEYSSIFAAIDELLPAYVRGRADLIIDGTWHLGSLIAAISSYLVLNNFTTSISFLSRLLFLIGALLAFPVIYMRKFVPESPRWLLYKEQYKDALKIVEEIEEQCEKRNQSQIETSNQTTLIPNTQQISTKKEQVLNSDNYREITFKDIFIILFFRYRTRFFFGLVLMASQAFFYNGIFYTYTLILQKFYYIDKNVVGLYLIPLSAASFTGPLVLGRFFDSWGRRNMILTTFVSTGLLLILQSIAFVTDFLPFVGTQVLWFMIFFIASPAASSAHLTVSEIFPLEMRSQAMAIFFSCGLGIGGVVAPSLYASFVNENNRGSIFFSYLITAFIMIFAGIFGYCNGVDAENKSLEMISKNVNEMDEEEKLAFI